MTEKTKKNKRSFASHNKLLAGCCLRLLCFFAVLSPVTANSKSLSSPEHEVYFDDTLSNTGLLLNGPHRSPSCSVGDFPCHGTGVPECVAVVLAEACHGQSLAFDGAGGALRGATGLWRKTWKQGWLDNTLSRGIFLFGVLGKLVDWVVRFLLLLGGSPRSTPKGKKRRVKCLKNSELHAARFAHDMRGFVQRWRLFHVATAGKWIGRRRMPKKHVDHSRKFLIRILHLKGKKKWARKLECFVTNKSREARLVRDYCGMVRESKVVPMSREWSEALKGGAYGAHMTKRKRKTRPSSGTEGDGSLAGALQSFLQKWEAGAPTKVRKTESSRKTMIRRLLRNFWWFCSSAWKISNRIMLWLKKLSQH